MLKPDNIGLGNNHEIEIRKRVEEYYEIGLSKRRITKNDYHKLISKLKVYDFEPFSSLIERAEKSHDPGLAQLLGALLAIIVAGYRPIIISDFDRTLTPFTEDLAQALRHILENRGIFGILTGNTKGAIDKKCIDVQKFKNTFFDNPGLLKQLHLFPKIASEHWTYEITQNKHQLVNSSELAEEIGKRDGDGNILPQQQEAAQRGELQLEQYANILKEMVAIFELESGIPGYSVKGKLVIDLGSQMDVRITGEDSTDEDRDAYVKYEEEDYKKRKVYLRELYAAYVNIKTGQFDDKRNEGQAILSELRDYLKARNILMPERPEASGKIPMKVRRAGRTNLEGVILGMDKSWGLTKIASLFDQPVWTIIFSGDELEEGGNDWPVLDMVSVLINVGRGIDKSFVNPFFITANTIGPEGLVSYYTLIGDVLEMVVKER